MGFLIDCPNCGPRPYTEFWCDGELRALPLDENRARDQEFERVWLRKNTAGTQIEQWFHHAGCRRWLTASRDTVRNVVDVRA